MEKTNCNLESRLDTSMYVKDLIENKYGFKVKHIERIKNVYKIVDFNEKVYALKVVKYEFSHFNFIYSAMKHLQENGFRNVLSFIKTVEGKEYIEFDERYIEGIKKVYSDELVNRYAYLNLWIIGRECNYSVMSDIEEASEKLSELHLKSRGFHVNSSMSPRNYVGKWIDNFETRRDEILDFKSRIDKKKEKSQFDIKYKNLMDRKLKLARNSIKSLEKNGYIEYMNNYESVKEFCHHDYANHNIIISNEGTFLIDFDYCILDTHLHDLASLIIRVMKGGNWNVDTAKHIIEVYSENIRVSPMEVQLICDFIEFPQSYWQLGIQYYWEKRSWSQDTFIKKLYKISEDSLLREDFIKKLREVNYGGEN